MCWELKRLYAHLLKLFFDLFIIDASLLEALLNLRLALLMKQALMYRSKDIFIVFLLFIIIFFESVSAELSLSFLLQGLFTERKVWRSDLFLGSLREREGWLLVWLFRFGKLWVCIKDNAIGVSLMSGEKIQLPARVER